MSFNIYYTRIHSHFAGSCSTLSQQNISNDIQPRHSDILHSLTPTNLNIHTHKYVHISFMKLKEIKLKIQYYSDAATDFPSISRHYSGYKCIWCGWQFFLSPNGHQSHELRSMMITIRYYYIICRTICIQTIVLHFLVLISNNMAMA